MTGNLKTLKLSPLDELLRRYRVLDSCADSIQNAISVLISTFENGGKLLIGGNGGSAADSEHIVSELMKGFRLPRQIPDAEVEILRENAGETGAQIGAMLEGALPAISLTSHPALVTAISNDKCGDMVFAQQLYALAGAGDAFLAISTSGNSRNVVNALHVAKLRDTKSIVLTGRNGGEMAQLGDIVIRVPADEVFEIQELHLPVYHTICTALEEHFFGETS